MRWQTLYFEDESDRYELKRYAPSDEHYIPHLNYCLSVVKPQFIFDRQQMRTEQAGRFRFSCHVDSLRLPCNRSMQYQFHDSIFYSHTFSFNFES